MPDAIPFTQLHGAGNDFVMFAGADLADGRLQPFQIAKLCDRRLGIGADGVIIVTADDQADFAMLYYNADGGEATMCGNGARCAVAFAQSQGLASAECRFRTAAGLLTGRATADGVEVSLPRWRDLALDIAVDGSPYPAHHTCNTGVPHLVIPTDDLSAVDVPQQGSILRHHRLFAPDGTNIDWVEHDAAGGVWLMRTYERGVEAETLACGTGAAAAAVVLVRLGWAASPVAIRTHGGDLLTIVVGDKDDSLRLRGPAVTVFTGKVVLDD